jgi:hypothetical protein
MLPSYLLVRIMGSSSSLPFAMKCSTSGADAQGCECYRCMLCLRSNHRPGGNHHGTGNRHRDPRVRHVLPARELPRAAGGQSASQRGITDYYNADHRQIVEDEQYRIASLDGHAHHEVHDTDVREQMWAALEE